MTASALDLRQLQSGLEEHTFEPSTVFPKVYGYPHTNTVGQMHLVTKAY